MKLRTLVSFCTAALLLLVPTGGGNAAPVFAQPGGGPRLEHLDRGLVAATTPQGVLLSWRLLGGEVTGHTATGLAGPAFRVYRDGQRIATVTDSTNYLDAAGVPGSRYRVEPVSGRGPDGRATPWAGSFYEMPLRKPADGVTPAG
jgi:Rhamnogalacturonan I lyases beta-sheet domain